jgi:hypothetical protein
MRHPSLVRPYFTNNYWNDPDVRHVNARGHRDMSRMVESLVFDLGCELVEGLVPDPAQAERKVRSEEQPEQVRQWGPWKHAKEEGDPHMMLGCWPPEDEMGEIPRVSSEKRLTPRMTMCQR